MNQLVTFKECNLIGNTRVKEFYYNTATLYKSFYDGDISKVNTINPRGNFSNVIPHFSLGSCNAQIPLKYFRNQYCFKQSIRCHFNVSILKILSFNLFEIS